MGETQELSLAEIKHAMKATRELLSLSESQGMSVRDFVEKWDNVWDNRLLLSEAADAAERLVAEYEKEGRDLSPVALESLARLMDFTRDFLTAMTTDKAPTPEQRTRASLERIEERLTAIETAIEGRL